MSSTWRYIGETRGHVREVYDLLLALPPMPSVLHLHGLHPESRPEFEAKYERWWESKVARVMGVVSTLEAVGEKELLRLFVDWSDHAIAVLGKAPSARAKVKFRDEEDRTLLLCSALWYGRFALQWIEQREEEGLLKGGLTYRQQTMEAAYWGMRRGDASKTDLAMLPEESDIVDQLEEDDPRVDRYVQWTYIDVGGDW